MRRTTTALTALAATALLVASCTGDTTEQPDEGGDAQDEEPADDTDDDDADEAADEGGEPGEIDFEAYGESLDADPALIEKALGPVDGVPDIVNASIARAEQDLDEETIAKALECWDPDTTECDTGTGGDVVMGYADGGGLNVWRQVTRMEATLQALTYDEIGTIVYRDAQWAEDPSVAAGDIRFLIEREVDFIIGYPDHGIALADAILEAEAAGIPYMPYSAGYVGLPSQDGALVPGEDYLSIVGEDLCALGESFAEVINEEVGEGTVGLMGGTPGNALSLGWQQCQIPAMNDGIELVGDPADTYWVNDIALQTVNGWLSAEPDIAAYSYEYADGLFTALDAYDQLGVELDDLVITVRTDEQTLFCDWAERDNPNYTIYFSAGGNFQSRVAVTAQMLNLQGAEIPGEIIVPHVMREVTEEDCDPDRATPTVSNTSLVTDEVLQRMYSES